MVLLTQKLSALCTISFTIGFHSFLLIYLPFPKVYFLCFFLLIISSTFLVFSNESHILSSMYRRRCFCSSRAAHTPQSYKRRIHSQQSLNCFFFLISLWFANLCPSSWTFHNQWEDKNYKLGQVSYCNNSGCHSYYLTSLHKLVLSLVGLIFKSSLPTVPILAVSVFHDKNGEYKSHLHHYLRWLKN